MITLKQIFLLFIYFFVAVVFGQTPIYYNLKEKYDFNSETVYSLFQDKNNHIWMGTEDGLIEYDGKHFKNYINPAFESEYTNIRQDKNGFIWCQNFSNQIFRIDDGELKLLYSLPPDYLIDSYLAFDVLNPPYIYMNTDYGILQYNVETKKERIIGGENKIKLYKRKAVRREINIDNKSYSNNYLNSLLIRQNDNQLVFSTFDKQFVYNEKRNEISSTNNFKSEKDLSISHVYNFHGSLKYFGYDNDNRKKIYKSFLDAKVKSFNEDDLEFASCFSNINGDIWIGSRDGVYLYDKHMNKKFSFLNGNYISDIIQDNQGNYWISTIKNGVIIIPNINTLLINSENTNLLSNSIKSIESIGKTTYVLDNTGTLFESDLEFSSFKEIYKDARLTKIVKFKNFPESVMLLGTDKQIKNTKVVDGYKLYTVKEVNNWDGNVFLVSTSNKVYITGNNSCYRVEYFSDFFDAYYRKDFFYDFDEVLLVDERRSYSNIISDNFFYVAYSNELRFYDKDKSLKVTYKGTDLVVKHLFKINDSVYAVSSTGNIYLLIKNKANLIASLFSRVLYVSYEDNELYLGTNKGAYTYSFNTGEFKLLEGSAGYHINDILKTKKSLNLATTSGIIIIPNTKSSDKISLNLKFNSITVNGKNLKLGESIVLNYKENSLNINYESFSPKLKKDLIFEYKLEPIDSVWKSTTSFYKDYEALQPGQYIFRIKAKGKRIYKDSDIKNLSFKITKPYYQKWWFYLSLISGSITIMTIIFIKIIKEIKLKNSLVQNKIRLENNLSNSRIQTINAQMNPHFVFNAMNSIQNLILKSKKNEAYKYLNEFSNLLRGVLSYGHKNAITIEEEIKLLENYLTLESLRFDKPISVEIKVSDSIFYEKIPPMLIQPFVENSVKHGFSSNNIQNKKVLLEFKYLNEEVIECLIFDNGAGFNSIPKNQTNHKSFSSEANKQKLNLLKQFYDYEIGLDFVDLTETKTSEYSTLVTIKIPILD